MAIRLRLNFEYTSSQPPHDIGGPCLRHPGPTWWGLVKALAAVVGAVGELLRVNSGS